LVLPPIADPIKIFLVLRSDLVPAQIRHVDVFRACSFDFQLFVAA
jgi:hypothetical protein